MSRFGQVQGCGYLPVAAGQLRTHTLKQIWDGSALFTALRSPQESIGGKCGSCEFVVDCMGCRARAYAVGQDPFAEEPHCAWVPQSLRPTAGSGHGH